MDAVGQQGVFVQLLDHFVHQRGVLVGAQPPGQIRDQRVPPVELQDLARHLEILLEHAVHALDVAIGLAFGRHQPQRVFGQHVRLAHFEHALAQHRREPAPDGLECVILERGL